MLGRVPTLVKRVSKAQLDAMDLLKLDHMKVELLFMQIRATRDKKVREKLVRSLAKELETHARLEESIFYPECEKHEELRDQILESYEEHDQIKTLLADIQSSPSGSPQFMAKLTVLMEDVNHHVQEEEETLFPKVRETLQSRAIARLTAELQQAKQGRASSKNANPKKTKKVSRAA